MSTRADLVDAARAWLGVPYQHQGRTRHGVDCIGLLLCVAHALGLSAYETHAYSRNPSGYRMARLMAHHLTRIDFTQVGPADVLHLATVTEPQHVAIVSRAHPLYVIHADSAAGRVVEVRLDERLLKRVRGSYRVPGLD